MLFAQGIHHITAIGSDPQRLTDFYTGILGLRLVKKSVNQDDVSAYHLFFGDKTGEPGMDLTFFTFPNVARGSRGAGLVTTISLAVPASSLHFWQDRFARNGVKHDALHKQFGRERLIFYDADDQRLELVGLGKDELPDEVAQLWITRAIGETEAIRHFHSARLTVTNKALVEPVLLEVLGYQEIEVNGSITLYQREGQARAGYLEMEEAPSLPPGRNASGTVHHIAFATEDEHSQLELRERLIAIGQRPTEVIDRYYFKSIYFRTPAGILFEIATMGPGFTADEAESELGQRLALPPFLEEYREQIEAGLTPVSVKEAL